MHEPCTDTARRGQSRVKRAEFQLFEEEHNDQKIHRGYSGQDQHHTWYFHSGNLHHVEGGGLQRSVKHTTGVEINMVGRLDNHHQSQCEERGEHDAHRCAFVDFSEVANPFGEDGGQQPNHHGSEKHRKA